MTLKVKPNRRTVFILEVLILAALLAVGACGGSGTEQSGEADTGGPSSAGPNSGRDGSGGDAREPANSYHLGQPRDDVGRYFGLYGDPGRGQFFVTEAKRPAYAERSPEIPPGYLAIGAMWADVAPMHMKSLSEMKFEQVDLSDFAPDEPNVAEFEFGPDGKAVALTFTSGGMSEFGRRPRVGDVPKEWQ